MGITVQYVAICDRCGKESTSDKRPDGWGMRGSREICPACIQVVDAATDAALYPDAGTGPIRRLPLSGEVKINGYTVELE
jgi:hypothetical protein